MADRDSLTGTGTRPLELAPFRAIRYNPAVVGDVGAVTCPPYDVIGSDHVADWEAADPHNVVRLILPRGGDRYQHAARDLGKWLADGILAEDHEPGLYVYQQLTPTGGTIGLVGAVSLHDPDERRILPHENVFPGPVRDRAALMRTVGAQLEPILLSYDGGGGASDLVDAISTTSPLLETRTDDGHVHRVWVTTDPGHHAAVAADLAARQALIADGHHRYAAYRSLRDVIPEASHGLAMLVDVRRHALELGPIHRSVANLPLGDAVAAAVAAFRDVREVRFTGTAPLLDVLAGERSSGTTRLAVTDGAEAYLLGGPDPVVVSESMPSDMSPLWRALDASLVTQVVIGELWGRSDDHQDVSYHHHATDAVARAAADDGVAVLLAAATHDDVMEIARRGERMPRKSTSFGPKPRTGLLMRRFVR